MSSVHMLIDIEKSRHDLLKSPSVVMAIGKRGWMCMSCQLRQLEKSNNAALKRSFSHTVHRVQAARPPNAPQQTPNVNHLKRNHKAYYENCLKRRYLERAEEVSEFDKQYERVAQLREEVQKPKRELRALEKRIGVLGAQKNGTALERSRMMLEAAELKRSSRLPDKEMALAEAEERLRAIALGQPSLTSPQTPVDNARDLDGQSISVPRLLEYLNYVPDSDAAKALQNTTRKSHTDIGTELSLLDFNAASTATGWGWYYLKSQAALLEQALIQYALSVLVRRGWTIISPPSLVYSYIGEACGFQPRDQNGEQQIYELASSVRDRSSANKPARSLTATAEIPLAAMLADQTIPSSQLPLKVAGVSRCYRAEAGARGTSSKGLYRVHEFNKVEMFAWTDSPSTSSTSEGHSIDPLTSPSEWTQFSTPVFDEMVSIQKEILTSLNLPCRVLEMPITDLGASAYRKIDIEAFFPSRYRRTEGSQDPDNGWGEVTSASICTDYQTRRLGTRVKSDGEQQVLGGKQGSTRFAHTVNGTAMAVPRVLAALMEYGYREGKEKGEKGSIEVPEVLKRWMPES